LGQGEAHDGLASKSTAERQPGTTQRLVLELLELLLTPQRKKKKDIPEVSGFSIGKMHETSLHVLFEKGC